MFLGKVCPFVMSHSQVLVQPCFCLYSRYVIDPTKHQLQQYDCKNRGLNLLPLLQCHVDAKDIWQDQTCYGVNDTKLTRKFKVAIDNKTS